MSRLSKLAPLACLVVLAGCCEQLGEEASALLQEYSACEIDDDCIGRWVSEIGYEGECISQFNCTRAFNVDADLDEFAQRANELSERYVRLCNLCVAPYCAGDLGGECNPETGYCRTTFDTE